MHQPLVDIDHDVNEIKSLSGPRFSVTKMTTFDYSICLHNTTTVTEFTVIVSIGKIEKKIIGKISKRCADLQTGLRNPMELEVERF